MVYALPGAHSDGSGLQIGLVGHGVSKDGIAIKTLQDQRDLGRHHYDHELPTLIREGGNLLALPARAQGARTKLVGLTWIEEWQTILVRPGSSIDSPEKLKGKRLALPAFRKEDLEQNRRGRSIARGMSLAGYKGVLASASLTLDDVTLVETGGSEPRTEEERQNIGRLWTGIEPLLRGEVDAVYVKGASAAAAARRAGAVVGIDLDKLPDRRFRVNNGTPRPITVHEELIDQNFDLLARFLAQTLRAAEWAKTHLAEVQSILESETRADDAGVKEAYRDGFHLSLAPDLSHERVEFFRQQKNFQLIHGLLDRDFDFDGWIDRRPLARAHELLAERSKVAAE